MARRHLNLTEMVESIGTTERCPLRNVGVDYGKLRFNVGFSEVAVMLLEQLV